MLRLADATLRLYRKGDGRVSVRWRGCFMIHAKGTGFRLAAYLDKFDMSATFTDGSFVKLDDYGYHDSCDFELDHMIHHAWASGVVDMPVIKDTAAVLRVGHRTFSFEGQGDPSAIEQVVPVIACGVRSLRHPRARSVA